MSSIYVVEDDVAISEYIALHLEAVGHAVTRAHDGAEVLSALYDGQHFDLALVDIMLPGVSGADLLEPLTSRGIPVIFLTAVADVDSKVSCLLSGAEDYVVKPFDMPEVLARITKVLERTGRLEDELHAGDITVQVAAKRVMRQGQPLQLTPLEFQLLLLLMRNRNVALSRSHILAEVWGQLFEGESRTVDVHIGQLRKKTGLPIKAVPKVGYRLEVPQ